MKTLGVVIAVIVAALGSTWIVQGNDFFMYRYFAPRYERVRRQTFEQTKSYRQGMAQTLDRLRQDYAAGNEAQRAAIADTVRHQYADLDETGLPPYLRSFLADVRVGR